MGRLFSIFSAQHRIHCTHFLTFTQNSAAVGRPGDSPSPVLAPALRTAVIAGPEPWRLNLVGEAEEVVSRTLKVTLTCAVMQHAARSIMRVRITIITNVLASSGFGSISFVLVPFP